MAVNDHVNPHESEFSLDGRTAARNLVLVILTLVLLVFMSQLNADMTLEIAPGLEGVVHEPGQKLVGLVVIAPGAGYDMSQPLILDAAEAATALGYRTLRFNWRYVTKGLGRGEGIGNEIRDLKDAMQYLKAQGLGDTPMVLIGKSLGSIVVANVAAEGSHPAILLTPICRSEEEFKNLYRPTGKAQVMIVGDQDPLCDLQVLFSHVDRSTRVSILKGDHGFNGTSSIESERNRAVVSNIVSYWLASWIP